MASIIPEINWIANGERADSVTLNRPLLEFLTKYETGVISLETSSNVITINDNSIISPALVSGDVVSLDTSNGNIVPASQSNIDFILGIIDLNYNKIYTSGTVPNSLVGNLALNTKYYLDYTSGNEGKLTSSNTLDQMTIGYTFDLDPSNGGNEVFFIDIGGGVIDADFLNGHNSDYFAKRNGDVTINFNTRRLYSSNNVANSLNDGAIVLSGSSGAILIDDAAQKRISWNDGIGNLNILSGVYSSSSLVDTYVGDNGASAIILNSDSADGAIYLKVAPQGTDNTQVTWSVDFEVNQTGAYVNGDKVLTTANTGSGNGLDADLLDGFDSSYFQRNLQDVGIVEFNKNGTGDRYSIFDFYSDDTNTNFSARLHREAGVDGNFYINNAGNGFITIQSPTTVQSSRQYGGLRNLTGTSITPDFRDGNFFYIDLETAGANVTLNNPINIAPGQSGSIYIKQASSASYTVTFSSSYKFPDGVAPVITNSANALDVVSFETIDGSTIVCSHTANFS